MTFFLKLNLNRVQFSFLEKKDVTFFLQKNNQRQVPKLLRIYTRREVNFVTENRLRAADSRNVFVCLYIFLKFTCHAKQRYKNDI